MQHSYSIPNQSGAAYRADLNDALAAIVSNNSGAAEPNPSHAFQWWSDTTSGILKQRNAANNEWIEILELGTGRPLNAVPQTGPDGVAILPVCKVADLVVANLPATGLLVTLDTDSGLPMWLDRQAGAFRFFEDREWVQELVRTRLAERPVVRQTVVSGPVDSEGYANFLPSTAPALSITTQNISPATPLVVTAAGGFDAYGQVDRSAAVTENLSFAGLAANSTNFLFVDIAVDGAVTHGSTTAAPTYQNGGGRSTANGQATFNIAEMSMTVGTGAAAEKAHRVYLGEVVTDASSVVSTVAYAYQGRYVGVLASVPSSAGRISKNHNIGVLPRSFDVRLICTSTDMGYSVGEEVPALAIARSDGATIVIATSATDKTLGAIANTSLGVFHKTTGSLAAISSGKWSTRFFANRGW